MRDVVTIPPLNVLDALPHRPPFRFLTSVSVLRPQETGEAVWRVEGTEFFLEGHFPDQPIVPGVLIVEALAQLSGLVGFHDPDSEVPGADRSGRAIQGGKLAHVDVRFKTTVVPPAEVALRSRMVRAVGALYQFEVEAKWAGRIVARGRLTLAGASSSEAAVPSGETP